MNYKFVLKALSFLLLTPFVFADDCGDIKDYLKEKYSNADFEDIIDKCNVNDQGKLTELTVINYYLQEEDVNKILSYNTIKDLTYKVKFKVRDLGHDYQTEVIEHPGYSSFPTAITNLPELEVLAFNYENVHNIKYWSHRNNTLIETGSLKLSKTLKKLSFEQINFKSQNMEELSTLTNLESLKLSYCKFDEVGLSPLGNIESLKTLTLYDSYIPNNINKIKSLEQLYFPELACESSDFYDFNGLDNLKSMEVTLVSDCKFDTSELEKLSEINIEGETSLFGVGVGSSISLKSPDNLKKLQLSHVKITSDTFKDISSLPNLEELSILYCSPDENIDFKSLECHDKLEKLTISHSSQDYTSKVLDVNFEILNDLNNLKYLDLSNNQIEKFPKQLASSKNLEHIDLSSNQIVDKIPESYNNLENLKYFNIAYNKSVGGKVLKNKNLKECFYGYNDEAKDICIPKDYEPNCLTGGEYKTCDDEEVESTDGKCGEGHGN